jgi:hypothetical protein
VYPAAEAPIGVVLRRGPSDWSRLSVWHTETDAIEHGQWLRGRVYSRRCDVSPDGSLFAYFVHKATGGPDVHADSWAAVSRPPYFTALALWAIGTTYFAGGHFIDGRTLYMSGVTDAPDIGAVPPWLRLSTDAPYIDRTPEWTDRTVHVNRLLRDGWRPAGDASDPRATWEHAAPSPDDDRVLVMAPALDADFSSYGGRNVDDYALRTPGGGLDVLGRATWAGFDHGGRLVMARDGQIVERQRDRSERVIADFNDQSPAPEAAPSWAGEWPAGA